MRSMKEKHKPVFLAIRIPTALAKLLDDTAEDRRERKSATARRALVLGLREMMTPRPIWDR